jgi:Protein of unknown function (DUF2971)
MIVYKYLSASRIGVFEQCRFRFTQPAALNDPFEALPCLTEYAAQIRERLEADPTTETMQSLLSPEQLDSCAMAGAGTLPNLLSKRFGAFCLSKNYDNLLMWSHYSDSHSGFVIGFDREHQIFAPGAISAEGLREVTYSKFRWVLPAIEAVSITEEQLREFSNGFFFSKNDNWAYEEELRIVARCEHANETRPGSDGWDVCLFDFPAEAIREVLFGFRMPLDERRKIAKVVQAKFPKAILFEALPDPKLYCLQRRRIA